jgi:hypothetical protein
LRVPNLDIEATVGLSRRRCADANVVGNRVLRGDDIRHPALNKETTLGRRALGDDPPTARVTLDMSRRWGFVIQ